MFSGLCRQGVGTVTSGVPFRFLLFIAFAVLLLFFIDSAVPLLLFIAFAVLFLAFVVPLLFFIAFAVLLLLFLAELQDESFCLGLLFVVGEEEAPDEEERGQ